MALALTPNLIWMIWTTVFESCCTEYGNKWQHVPASWLFCSISPHLGWDCVWDGLCGRTTAKIPGQRQQETAGKMTQGLSHFQKKHESTFLDNKKINRALKSHKFLWSDASSDPKKHVVPEALLPNSQVISVVLIKYISSQILSCLSPYTNPTTQEAPVSTVGKFAFQNLLQVKISCLF